MIKDLESSVIIIKYAWTQCDVLFLYTGLKSTLNHLIYTAIGAEIALFFLNSTVGWHTGNGLP